MSRRQDSRLISEMKEQLRRLQERRQELESRHEDDAIRQPIVPHLSRIMRDRQLAQVRALVQRNMDTIDQDIQESIARLGSAMLLDSDQVSSLHHFPDLIPVPTKPTIIRQSSSNDTSRQELLEAVKETLLEKRHKQHNNAQSPRVGFYECRHETDEHNKLSRLSVQKLPSVTIATRGAARPINHHIIDVQSSSIVQAPELQGAILDIQPDDVARLVSDILSTQLELAVDSLEPMNRQSRDDADDDEFRLTIDNCTQTAIPNVKDSSTMMDALHQTDRAVGPDSPPLPPKLNTEVVTERINVPEEEEEDYGGDQDDDKLEEEEEEESLTPPRSRISIAPEPTPDLNLWRQHYPPPPSPMSCTESLIRSQQPTHESSSTSTTTTTSSDATGISSSATISSSVDLALSWLSEGEVPNRVTSPGQVRPTGTSRYDDTDRSNDATLSEGQIPLGDVLPVIQLPSSLLDGVSEGEVLNPTSTTRSDSTASFRSAAGSLGEIPAPEHSSSLNDDDDLDTE